MYLPHLKTRKQEKVVTTLDAVKKTFLPELPIISNVVVKTYTAPKSANTPNATTQTFQYTQADRAAYEAYQLIKPIIP